MGQQRHRFDKGVLCFRADTIPSVVKFLGFEQTFKYALIAPPIGVANGDMDVSSHKLSYLCGQVKKLTNKGLTYGLGYDLVAGANIAGFKKVATAMMEQGAF